MTEEKTKTNKDRLENIKQAIFERIEENEDKTFDEIEDDLYNALNEQLDNEVIYYVDQDAIVVEYGIREAIEEWNESDYADLNMELGLLAYFLLEKMFTEKYSMKELYEECKKGELE